MRTFLFFIIILAWPQVTRADTVAERLVELGNKFFDQHVDTLSHDLLTVRIDGKQQRAQIAVGGDSKHVGLRVASNVQISDGTAHISSRLAVAIGGKRMTVRLPNVDVAPTSYRGERGVELRLPLLRKTF